MILKMNDNVVKMTTLGDYISRLRVEKNISQRDLAKRAGFTQGTLQKIESGSTLHPGLDVITGVAKALNISPVKLLMAYQGKDPDSEVSQADRDDYKAFLMKVFSEMPSDLLLEALKAKYPDREKLNEIKRKVMD